MIDNVSKGEAMFRVMTAAGSRRPGHLYRAGALGMAVAVLMTGYSGCSPTPSSVADHAGPKPAGEAWIVATPNPVPAGRGSGATTLTWDTGDGSTGRVRLSIDGGTERPVSDSPTCTHYVTGIGRGLYEFRLYSGDGRPAPLATVKVTRKPR